MNANIATEHQAPERIPFFNLAASPVADPMTPAPEGDWLRRSDFMRAMLNPHGHQLTKNDAAIYKLFQHILDATVTAEQDPAFCGYQMEELMTGDGLLLGIRLVACETVGDVAVPRAV